MLVLKKVVIGRSWNKIPEDLRAKFQEGVDKGVQAQRALLLKANADAKKVLMDKGVTFHDIDINSLKDAYAKMQLDMNFDPKWVEAVSKVKSQY